jgi:hypothetical protein
MNKYHVFCKEKKGFWVVLADSEKEAIYETTKGHDHYTKIFVVKVYSAE